VNFWVILKTKVRDVYGIHKPVMKPAHITMILGTKDGLWNTAVKDHWHLKNEKPKPLLESHIECILEL